MTRTVEVWNGSLQEVLDSESLTVKQQWSPGVHLGTFVKSNLKGGVLPV